MSRWKDNLQMYWPVAVGTLLFLPSAWRYYSIGMWEKHIASAAFAVFGYVCTIAPEQVSSWTGRYGWTYESFWTYPANYVRFCGLATLVCVLLFGFK